MSRNGGVTARGGAAGPGLARTFGWSFAATLAGLALATVVWGWRGLTVVAILSVLEISLSFDNAVVNAGILRRLNAFWQKMFLTVGVLIAVFGMRLVFPLVIVTITARVGPVRALDVAIHDPDRYQRLVTSAHPAIAAFGGIFLLMIFLDFILQEREHAWLTWLERPLARLGRLESVSVAVALGVLLVTAATLAAAAGETTTVLFAGVAGMLTYLAVGGVSGYFEGSLDSDEDADAYEDVAGFGEADDGPRSISTATSAPAAAAGGSAVRLAGRAAFFLFIYLEVIDASFSFDGVIGAFAVTNRIFMIALGLGIGACYIRSLTVFLVRKGTLDDYVYLEHGAHYAIGALAILLLLTIRYQVNDVITGLVGIVLILASFVSSVVRNRRLGEDSRRTEEQTKIVTRV